MLATYIRVSSDVLLCDYIVTLSPCLCYPLLLIFFISNNSCAISSFLTVKVLFVRETPQCVEIISRCPALSKVMPLAFSSGHFMRLFFFCVFMISAGWQINFRQPPPHPMTWQYRAMISWWRPCPLCSWLVFWFQRFHEVRP